ncbi:MAG: kynureninase [Bacteroidetes bacterium HGW-Bacteroidetes-15]|nr:MAG: kynureninase [Bacteroidetes bacterium HGW-Bacteroidetes-15]
MSDIYSASYALQLDEQDELKSFRGKFQLNDPNLIYLDGNSLGILPNPTKPYINQVIEKEWGDGLIRSWNEGWYDRSANVGAKLARIIGAQPDEVIVADSTSVNLFKLAYAALKFQEGKQKIVSDTLNFPSDLYIIQGLIDIFGNRHRLELAKSSDGISVSMDELERQITSDTALVTLSHVVFKSAFMYNMKEVTRLTHSKGAMIIWDLSHAVGSVPVKLNESNADMAIGCTYKYLNGGPGAPAFLYVRKDLQEKLQSPIWGWFGQHKPFDFNLNYQPAEGISRFLAGTPPLLSLSTVEPSLDLILEAGIDKIRVKSISQSNYLLSQIEKFLVPLGFSVGSPINSEHRGSHISIRHMEAYRICKALIDSKVGNKVVIPDFREPDNIRLGIAPLYNTFTEIYQAIMQIKDIVENREFELFKPNRDIVT